MKAEKKESSPPEQNMKTAPPETKKDKGRTRPRGKEQGRGKGPTQVHWPKEYADFAAHVVETAVSRPLTAGSAKTKMNRIILFSVGTPVPTDKDDEFGDGAQNGYKIIKSLTSGARFYTETTLYTYRVAYRYLAMLLARAYGLLGAIKTKVDVSNAPNFAAYQMVRASITMDYLTAVENIPKFEKEIYEMVSELNSLPLPTIGGLNDYFEVFSHIYKDDKAAASDYYVFCPDSIGEFTYDDSTHLITAVTRTQIHALDISGIAALFFSIVDDLRNSIDINNMMADILNVLPSSRFDWMTVLDAHKDVVRTIDGKLMSSIGSAPMIGAALSNVGTLDSSGRRVALLRSNIGTPPSGWVNGLDDVVGQFVTTYKGASEASCYKFMAHNESAAPGFTPGGTDRISNTGLVLALANEIVALGSPVTGPTYRSVAAMFTDAMSTIQSTAEQGGKDLGILYTRFNALPKIDLDAYGNSGSDDNLLWRSEDVRIAPVNDILNNVKIINQVAFSTMHLTTEKAR